MSGIQTYIIKTFASLRLCVEKMVRQRSRGLKRGGAESLDAANQQSAESLQTADFARFPASNFTGHASAPMPQPSFG